MNADLLHHIEALNAYVVEVTHQKSAAEELKNKKGQLRELQASIHRLERNHIPVPEAFKELKLSLVAAIEGLREDSEADQVYEALLDLVERLGRLCQRRPDRDFRDMIRERVREVTPAKVLREEIIRALEGTDGGVRESEVMLRVEQQLKGRFTEADLERPIGKRRCRWQDNMRSERKKMIGDGVLTRRSAGSTWMLAQDDKKRKN
ncbi:MAG TPA: hypothetical protein PLX34_22270 [Sedimentisphaerales bacterium]|jgi:hypothetical protein|nr:hypothetical protein [Sedimentisphaerales bacterium]HQN36148.1 hypothetical protein [Sedimentisphaerales bacterium]